MLEIHAALAVYSHLGNSREMRILDVLGNETAVRKSSLPEVLADRIRRHAEAVRRRSVRVGDEMPEVPDLPALVGFSRRLQPAFSMIMERNVESGRWPGNFSTRCSHGFLSARQGNGFAITRRNVDKEGLKISDFVWVRPELEEDRLVYSGTPNAQPSVDAPVHRLLYARLPWVKAIVHGHLRLSGDPVYEQDLPHWPCGAENEAHEILKVAPREPRDLWAANVAGHGFIALIGGDVSVELENLANLGFTR